MNGHIRRRGERSWELKFDAGVDPLTGKRLTRYHSFKGTKREAKAELVKLVNAVNTGTYVDPSKATLGEFLDRWERDWAAINVSPKTLERYRELLRVHVRPRLAALPTQKLQPVHLAELYAKLLNEQHRAPRTVGHVHRVLHKALAVAMEWGSCPATWPAWSGRRRSRATPRSKYSTRIRCGLSSNAFAIDRST